MSLQTYSSQISDLERYFGVSTTTPMPPFIHSNESAETKLASIEKRIKKLQKISKSSETTPLLPGSAEKMKDKKFCDLFRNGLGKMGKKIKIKYTVTIFKIFLHGAVTFGTTYLIGKLIKSK